MELRNLLNSEPAIRKNPNLVDVGEESYANPSYPKILQK
jgi:hypothetical protein